MFARSLDNVYNFLFCLQEIFSSAIIETAYDSYLSSSATRSIIRFDQNMINTQQVDRYTTINAFHLASCYHVRMKLSSKW